MSDEEITSAAKPRATPGAAAVAAGFPSNDRVSYSASRKVYDKRLGSFEVGFTYTTNVGADETPAQAASRAFAFVDRAVENRLSRVKAKIEDDGLSETNIDKKIDEMSGRRRRRVGDEED